MFREHLRRADNTGFLKHYTSIKATLDKLQKVNIFTQRVLVYSNISSSLGDDSWPRPQISDPSSFNTKSSSLSYDSKPLVFAQNYFGYPREPAVKIETTIKDYLNSEMVKDLPGKKLKTHFLTNPKHKVGNSPGIVG